MKRPEINHLRRPIIIIGLATAFLLAGSGCAYLPFLAPKPSEPPLYLACNLWFVQPQAVSSLNYKQGAMIPAGTEIRSLRLYPTTGRIQFIEMLRRKKIRMNVDPQLHPGLSLQVFSERMFIPNNWLELTAGMTEQEIACVKAGEVRTGIRKAAVWAAWGWPDDRWNASDSLWHYCLDRGSARTLSFDAEGILVGIKDWILMPGSEPIHKYENPFQPKR